MSEILHQALAKARHLEERNRAISSELAHANDNLAEARKRADAAERFANELEMQLRDCQAQLQQELTK